MRNSAPEPMNQDNSNHFLDGIFWGVVLGGAAVFLTGTKRGREISKILKEEGLFQVSKLEELIALYQESIASPATDNLQKFDTEITDAKEVQEEKVTPDTKKPRKSFFKGLPKRK